MSLDATMNAGMQGVHVLLFGAVEIVFPSHTARLLDGAGTVTFSGKTFTGIDSAIGVLDQLQAISDGVDNQAPEVHLSILPAGSSAVTTLLDPAAQGSAVTIWVGLLNPTTGAVVGTPDVRFVGQWDVAVRRLGRSADVIEATVVSAFEHFFDGDEGVRLNDAWHQSIWPGETGLAGVTYVQRQLPWGSDAPRPSSVTDVLRTSGGGGGGLAAGLSNTAEFNSL